MLRAEFQDAVQLAKKSSPRKLNNAWKLWASYHQARHQKKTQIPALPMALSIEPTTSCNLRCPECPSGLRSFKRPTGMLGTPLMAQVLDELGDFLFYLNFYFQGEPYLNPDFFELVRMAHEKKIYTATSTNAHFLSPERAEKTIQSGLDRLIISIDGTTQKSYEAYRIGGSLNKVLEGTRNLIAMRKKMKGKRPFLVFQFLVVKPNEHQLEDLKKLAASLGVDAIQFKSAQLYDYELGSPLLPDNPKYSRYILGRDGRYQIKNQLLNQCWRMWHSAVITWDGRVVPCCFDKDASYTMGQLGEKTFQSIWNSEDYQNFRRQLLNGRKEIDICKNCTEGTKVWVGE